MQRVRSFHTWMQAQEALAWLDLLEAELARRPFSPGQVIKIASIAYYLGRMAERYEMRQFEATYVEGIGDESRALTAARQAALTAAKKKRDVRRLVREKLKGGDKITKARFKVARELDKHPLTVTRNSKGMGKGKTQATQKPSAKELSPKNFPKFDN